MKDEIKEKIKAYYINNDIDKVLDYITNLQEKSNNQVEEINRLVKQREKFMKKYDYLQEEKDKYKNVIDKIKEDLIKTKKYNTRCRDTYGNELIKVDIDHINYLLELLEEVE